MARPKNTNEEKRLVRIAFMVSESEEQEIRALAKAHGFDQHGAFIRSASLGKIPVDRDKVMMTAFPLATTASLSDIVSWADDPSATPVLMEYEAQYSETFYDGRVDQELRISDGKPADGSPEKPEHLYHKPLVVPYPYPNGYSNQMTWSRIIRFGKLWCWGYWIDVPAEFMANLDTLPLTYGAFRQKMFDLDENHVTITAEPIDD